MEPQDNNSKEGFGLLNEMPSFEEHMRKRKTWQEKAIEKNYYQDEQGEWWEKGDDYWGDGQVQSFKLDVEYPDLADKTEELAEKYGVWFGDGAGLKKIIYDNAERLNGASYTYWQDFFKIRSELASASIGGTEEILLGYDEEQLASITDALETYYQIVQDQLNGAPIPDDVPKVAEIFVREYNEKMLEGNFLNEMSIYAAKTSRRGVSLGINCGIRGISSNESNWDLFGEYMQYYTGLLDDDQKITRYETRGQVLASYVRSHGIDEDTVSGFRDVVFPLLEQQNEEVTSILKGGNAYGMGAVATELRITPRNVWYLGITRPRSINWSGFITKFRLLTMQSLNKIAKMPQDCRESLLVGVILFMMKELAPTKYWQRLKNFMSITIKRILNNIVRGWKSLKKNISLKSCQKLLIWMPTKNPLNTLVKDMVPGRVVLTRLL